MNQVTFEFDPQQAEAHDSTGFDLGWDHAHHGLVPPAELLLDGTPIGQGWRAGKAVFGRRTLAATRHVRLWLRCARRPGAVASPSRPRRSPRTTWRRSTPPTAR